MSDSAITRAFADLRARGRPALIPYLTAGYPDLRASEEALRAADELADVLVVGVPFSDPLADFRPTAARARRLVTGSGRIESTETGAAMTHAVAHGLADAHGALHLAADVM